MNSLHPASLVDSSLHSKAMLQLLELDIDRNLIQHLVQVTVDTVAYAYGSSSSSRGRSTSRSNKSTAFADFAANVISRSEVTISVLLVALVYMNRSKPHLSIETEDWACERVFLGALILASKYTNDSTLKNIHWALVTGTFGKRDVGRIEREFLDVLDWDLSISEADILDHHDTLMALSPRPHHMLALHHASPTVSPTTSIHSASWSDSDSDGSSSPLPLTPPTPSHPPVYVKSPVHTSQPFHLSNFFTQSWNTSNSAARLQAALPQVRVAV